ncbi:hypothetical protein SLA2020_520830 [Shorea laevis]
MEMNITLNGSGAGEYQITKTNDFLEACYLTNTSSGIWQSGSALTTTLPFLLTQLFVVLFLDRILLSVLKPLHQPRIVAHITCGVLLGPTFLGETDLARSYVIPYKTTMVLETFANLALVYYMFLVGLEMDFSLILGCGTKPLTFAIAGILLPLGVGFGLFFLALSNSHDFDAEGSMFWAIVLTSTNFPDLARVLANLKLLHSDIGRTAMCSAIISDLCSWLLLVVAISILNTSKYYALLSTTIFVLVSVFLIRPALSWLIGCTSKGEQGNIYITDNHVWFILAGIVLFGFITDACGSHSIFGAFMFGVIMPQEYEHEHGNMIRSTVIEKLDDFVTGILMPLFFLVSGLRTDVAFMLSKTPWIIVMLVVVVSCAAKIASAFLVSLLYRMPPREGLALGLLMNTKGVLALVILNTGRNIKALNNQSFPLMVLSLLVMSSLVEPIIAYTYQPKHLVNYRNRTIQRATTKLRILVCVHSIRNVSGILSLLNLSNATNQSPLCIFCVHLVELTGRASTAVLIVHDEFKPTNNRTKTETGQINIAFDNFEKRNTAVTVRTITAVSPYATMHVDVCNLAEDKRVALIILPFHKQMNADCRMGNINSTFADVNHNVLMNAPCSVGILVDRGLGSKRVDSQHGQQQVAEQIAMLFIGGPDDREALAYAWRMAGHPNVRLTVVRFILRKDAALMVEEREKKMDDEYIYEFKFKTMQDSSINYMEKVVKNSQETIAAIRTMGDVYDLYVVGRGKGVKSPSTLELSNWSICPELGIIGDLLGSSNFALHASVLVVQQYSYGSPMTPNLSNRSNDDDNDQDEGYQS